MLENIYISNISFVFKPAESRELIKSFNLAVETRKFIEQIKSYSNLKIVKGVRFFFTKCPKSVSNLEIGLMYRK